MAVYFVLCFQKKSKVKKKALKNNISIIVASFIYAYLCLILIIVRGLVTAVRCNVKVFIFENNIESIEAAHWYFMCFCLYMDMFLMRTAKAATAAD